MRSYPIATTATNPGVYIAINEVIIDYCSKTMSVESLALGKLINNSYPMASGSDHELMKKMYALSTSVRIRTRRDRKRKHMRMNSNTSRAQLTDAQGYS
jgi:hypothetical protein